MPYLLTILLCVAADQAVKYYVVTHLALYESAPLLPGLVELYYIRNTGEVSRYFLTFVSS